MTSYGHSDALLYYFNFCQLWRPIEVQDLIFTDAISPKATPFSYQNVKAELKIYLIFFQNFALCDDVTR